MDPVDLNELPSWSDWPARMLLADLPVEGRTLDRVEAEYEQDKYAKCLDELKRKGGTQVSAEDIKRFEFGQYGMATQTTVCVSRGDQLFTASLSEARDAYYELLAQHLEPELAAVNNVVELGCGYGFNLWWLSKRFPGKRWHGGEYSRNAVELAQRLYGAGNEIAIHQFNFYDATYAILDAIAGPMVIFTSHAIEQLPSAQCVMAALAGHRRRIAAVVHFEPGYEAHRDGLLGLMRRRYAEINDYNRDLVGLLAGASNVQITALEPDAFGLNPLNPTTVIRWQFVSSADSRRQEFRVGSRIFSQGSCETGLKGLDGRD